MDNNRMRRAIEETIEELPTGAACSNIPRWVKNTLFSAGLSVAVLSTGGCHPTPKPVHAGPPPQEEPPAQKKTPVDQKVDPAPVPLYAKRPTTERPPAPKKAPPEVVPEYGVRE